MIGIQVGMNLKDKSGHRLFGWLNRSLLRGCFTGRRSNAKKCLKQLQYTEVIECTAKEERSQITLPVELKVKGFKVPFNQGGLLLEPEACLFTDMISE